MSDTETETQRQIETEMGREMGTSGPCWPLLPSQSVLTIETSVTGAGPGSWVSMTTPEVCHQPVAFRYQPDSREQWHRAACPPQLSENLHPCTVTLESARALRAAPLRGRWCGRVARGPGLGLARHLGEEATSVRSVGNRQTQRQMAEQRLPQAGEDGVGLFWGHENVLEPDQGMVCTLRRCYVPLDCLPCRG